MTNPQKTRRSPSIIENSSYAPGQPHVDDRRQRLESLGKDPAEITRAKREMAQIARQQGGRASAQIALDDIEVQQRKSLRLVVAPEQLLAAPTAPDAEMPQPTEVPRAASAQAANEQRSPAAKQAADQNPVLSDDKKAQVGSGAQPSRMFEYTERQPARSAPTRSLPVTQPAAHPRDQRYGAHAPLHDLYQPWETLGPAPRGQFFVLLLVALVSLAVIWMFFQSPKTFISPYAQAALGNTVGAVVSKVFGGDEQSSLFKQSLAVNVPEGEHSILGQPSLTVDQIEAVLAQYNSPAQGTGKAWIALGKQYGIDPAYPLAFFVQESTAGTNAGWAGLKSGGGTTHNVGNIICAGYATCYKGNRDYPSWEAGLDDWYRLIDREYVEGRGLASVEQILPVYCPVSDGCRSYDYIAIVNSMVDKWHQGLLFQ